MLVVWFHLLPTSVAVMGGGWRGGGSLVAVKKTGQKGKVKKKLYLNCLKYSSIVTYNFNTGQTSSQFLGVAIDVTTLFPSYRALFMLQLYKGPTCKAAFIAEWSHHFSYFLIPWSGGPAFESWQGMAGKEK